MYFCSLFAILGTEIDVFSVMIGDTVNDQHHCDSGRVTQVKLNGRQYPDSS
jgi:hypothetical protein